MEKEARLVVYSTARFIFILFLIAHLLYTEFSALKAAQIIPWKQHLFNWNGSSLHAYSNSTVSVPEPELGNEVLEPKLKSINVTEPTLVDVLNSTSDPEPVIQEPHEAEKHEDSLNFQLARLVQEEQRSKFELTGLACDSAFHSLVCVVNKVVRINTKSTGVGVLLELSMAAEHSSSIIVRPYARQEDEYLLKSVTPVEILEQDNKSSLHQDCQYKHDVPAVVFSTSGFTGNLFHELNEIIIPLFITSFHFRSNVQFIITDYKASFVSRYGRLLSRLSHYQVMNPAVNSSMIHCFPGAVVGLKFHNFLGLNSSEIPRGYFMKDFKHFLQEAYGLKTTDVSRITRPRLMLISRQSSRMFLNEKQLAEMMEGLGFRVTVVKPKMMKNLVKFAKIVRSCSVMVGAHGAGLANEVFLPAGAAVVQVVPLGLDWASNAYFGEPAHDMGVHYLEYKIEPEESSLIDTYKRDDPIITDPTRVLYNDYQAGRALYIDGQNMKINLTRFKEILVEALKLLEKH